jgi:hypothetical protein
MLLRRRGTCKAPEAKKELKSARQVVSGAGPELGHQPLGRSHTPHVLNTIVLNTIAHTYNAVPMSSTLPETMRAARVVTAGEKWVE